MKYVKIYTDENDQIILEIFNENATLEQVQNKPTPSFVGSLTPTIKQICDLDIFEHAGSCCDFKSTDHIDKWYLDGNEIKVDNDWVLKLMPKSVIHSKNIIFQKNKINSELNKQNPDLLLIINCNQNIEKVLNCAKHNAEDKKDIYEQALANLDERVANGEPDKTVIRQKLEAKIASFE